MVIGAFAPYPPHVVLHVSGEALRIGLATMLAGWLFCLVPCTGPQCSHGATVQLRAGERPVRDNAWGVVVTVPAWLKLVQLANKNYNRYGIT